MSHRCSSLLTPILWVAHTLSSSCCSSSNPFLMFMSSPMPPLSWAHDGCPVWPYWSVGISRPSFLWRTSRNFYGCHVPHQVFKDWSVLLFLSFTCLWEYVMFVMQIPSCVLLFFLWKYPWLWPCRCIHGISVWPTGCKRTKLKKVAFNLKRIFARYCRILHPLPLASSFEVGRSLRSELGHSKIIPLTSVIFRLNFMVSASISLLAQFSSNIACMC